MTWNELTEQINSWLSFKRKAAESANELPGMTDVQKRLFDAFMQALNDGNESEGESRILKLAQKHGLDTRDAGIETIALLDIQAEDRMPEGVAAVNVMQVCTHPGPTALLSIGTWEAGHFTALFQWAVLSKDIDGVTVPTRIIVITFGEDTDVWGKVELAVKIQGRVATSGFDFFNRWFAASYEFRATHIVCPRCGRSSIVMKETCYVGKKVVGCSTCDWHAHSPQVDDMLDLTNAALFRNELKYVEKQRRSAEEMGKITGELKALSSRLAGAADEYFELFSSDCGTANVICNLADELKQSAAIIGGPVFKRR